MDTYSKRKDFLNAFFILIGIIFVLRMFGIQVISSEYKQYATRNILRPEVIYPARGLVYDRNGKLLVQNKAAYDLMVTPREVKSFDTLEMCDILDITKEELIEEMKKARSYSPYKPSPVVKQISPETYAPLQEKLYKYPGFYVQTRTLREYPRGLAGHVLGYVSEVTQKNIDANSYYKSGDYIGSQGLEESYEEYLRGRKGINHFLVDVHNRKKGSYNEGKMDTSAILGKNLIATLDADLQEYAEMLLQNKKGSVVAIEPSTGEVLVCASAPSYDPNILVGRGRGALYSKLSSDTLNPLINRAISAFYSPGSTFKTINILVALQENAITPETCFHCSGKASSPIKCTHSHAPTVNAQIGIRESCNPYFWNVFRSTIGKYPNAEKGYNVWRNHVMSFGLGQKINHEMSGLAPGLIPESESYNKMYGKGRWNAMTIRSLAIGQGEVSVTPFQMANMVAVIANRGYYIEPHLVRSVQEDDNEYRRLEFVKKQSTIDQKHFRVLIDGMQSVVEETSSGAYNVLVDSITICGKTGTIQNPHGSDHSAFIAFAPKENPKIAISVYIENGVWGARYAAPIASLIIEKYLKGKIPPKHLAKEQRMRDANLLNSFQPK
ncbi:MAG: penicillin-binding protein 2 [Bacteroidetes bacterium GWF2_42_66]|nr:MAG: penicillin-binding protein 2 [Bacteroidetes bacterium GWA2_42_15]OFY03559.1 MAG: penicillin-binding protein 2 [Bacteroidetes bacterium GWE2_42_39]OFY45924.1 MAG: penicillin-binding protein 2 [Bacteroidetes bacterium GWF2_42_66]HBL75166.1 penicillin-binding protein 2 [Prolixibacteraceae bacterium]HCR89717.1 penicillin-binding protein 2 [Prolixibacteraceae bacterium]